MPEKVTINLAGIPIEIDLHYREVKRYFRHWLRRPGGQGEFSVSVSKEEIDAEFQRYPSDAHPGNAELTALIYRLSDKLLSRRMVFFHGLAMRFKEKAWIFTGQSGVGKTTQYRLFQKLHGSEVDLICGDKPVIEASADGTVWVHPSPWNGKENLKSCMEPAPLGGMICLRQDMNNSIYAMPNAESVMFLFRQMMFLPNCRENILLAGEVLAAMMKSSPVWLLANKGDDASAEMAYSTMKAGCIEKVAVSRHDNAKAL